MPYAWADVVWMLTPGVLAALARSAGLAEPSIVVAPAGRLDAANSLEPRRPLYPASMIKVPIAVALANAAARGRSLQERVEIGPGVMTANDAPSAFTLGAVVTLAEALAAMLSASDNVATNVLIDALGRETIGPAVARYGATATAVRRKLSGSEPLIVDPLATGRNAHPAFDAAILFDEIARREAAGDRLLWHPLAAQIWNDKLSRGLRAGDHFAHKTGDTDEASHDGGILTLEEGPRIILVVYTALPSNPQSDAKLAGFARELRPYLSSLANS